MVLSPSAFSARRISALKHQTLRQREYREPLALSLHRLIVCVLNILVDTATVRNLVAVSLSPLADCCGLGVALDRSGGATGGTGALGSGALHAAGLRYEVLLLKSGRRTL